MNIPIEISVIVFSYLNLDELCQCEKVCKSWYQILYSSNASGIYQTISLQRKNANTSMKWLKNKVQCHKPKSLNFSGSVFNPAYLNEVLEYVKETLISLDISFHLLKTSFYSNIKLDKLEAIIINDCKLSDSSLEQILMFKSLKYLNVNYNSSLTGLPFAHTEKDLKSLWFEGCEHIEYIYILDYVKNHGKSLLELGIDGEYFSSADVCSILDFTPNLTKFSIEYANEMDSLISIYLCKDTWEHLKIRRALYVPQVTFSYIFNTPLAKLVYLNLAECTYIDDMICLLISQNCIYITSFILTWCSDVSDQGILKIVQNCECLKFMDLTGLKEISDESFPLDDLKIYHKLDTLVLEKCNKISDNHLWRLSNRYSWIKIKNYYGEFKEGWTGAIYDY